MVRASAGVASRAGLEWLATVITAGLAFGFKLGTGRIFSLALVPEFAKLLVIELVAQERKRALDHVTQLGFGAAVPE
jgi:phage terminase large subunit